MNLRPTLTLKILQQNSQLLLTADPPAGIKMLLVLYAEDLVDDGRMLQLDHAAVTVHEIHLDLPVCVLY